MTTLHHSDIKWAPDTYTPKEFVNLFKYRMPLIVKLTERQDTVNANTGGRNEGKTEVRAGLFKDREC